MKKVVVSGYYGFNNIGDDAMIETFSKYFLAEIIVLSLIFDISVSLLLNDLSKAF